MTESADTPSPPAPVSLATFLEAHAPGSSATIADANRVQRGAWAFDKPDIQLHCDSEACGGKRIFRCSEGPSFLDERSSWRRAFMVYVCRNCGTRVKSYALLLKGGADHSAHVYKIGEYPAFGPPLPSRLISIIGPDRELFLRGRRSENQGLGLGAFAYYRRVVENQWQRIIGEVIRASERIEARSEVVEKLRAAAKESQFSRAVDLAKDAVPESLRIRGHNPLTLLHGALSEGLHARGDDDCLVLASSIRVVLAQLAERIAEVLQDEKELAEALNRLLNRDANVLSSKELSQPDPSE